MRMTYLLLCSYYMQLKSTVVLLYDVVKLQRFGVGMIALRATWATLDLLALVTQKGRTWAGT